jgi:DnaJ family protein C protein 7
LQGARDFHQATAGEISAAYKKLAIAWHPDRFRDEERKKEAEQKVSTLNQAYSLLNDRQKKEFYDGGGDPAEFDDLMDLRGFAQGLPPGFPFEEFFGPDGKPRRNFEFEFEFH